MVKTCSSFYKLSPQIYPLEMNWKSAFATIRKLSRFFWLAWAAIIILVLVLMHDPDYPTMNSRIPFIVAALILFVLIPKWIFERIRDYVSLGNVKYRLPFTVALFASVIWYWISLLTFLKMFINKMVHYDVAIPKAHQQDFGQALMDYLKAFTHLGIDLLKTSHEGKTLIAAFIVMIGIRIFRSQLFNYLGIVWNMKTLGKSNRLARKNRKSKDGINSNKDEQDSGK